MTPQSRARDKCDVDHPYYLCCEISNLDTALAHSFYFYLFTKRRADVGDQSLQGI